MIICKTKPNDTWPTVSVIFGEIFYVDITFQWWSAKLQTNADLLTPSTSKLKLQNGSFSYILRFQITIV